MEPYLVRQSDIKQVEQLVTSPPKPENLTENPYRETKTVGQSVRGVIVGGSWAGAGYLFISTTGFLTNHWHAAPNESSFMSGFTMLATEAVLGVIAWAGVWCVKAVTNVIGRQIAKGNQPPFMQKYDEFMAANLPRIRDLNLRINAFNNRLAVTKTHEQLLFAQDKDAFDEIMSDLELKGAALQAERDALAPELLAVLKPFHDRNTLIDECKKVGELLNAYEESARDGRTMNTTAMSLAINAREKLVERAEELGIDPNIVPAIPRSLVPKRLLAAR